MWCYWCSYASNVSIIIASDIVRYHFFNASGIITYAQDDTEETIQEKSSEQAEYVYEDIKVRVTVHLQEGTTIAANAELTVTEIEEGTENYNNTISKLSN